MFSSPVVVSLPIADRRTSFTFYGKGLGFEAIGEPAEDGVPEPLQFALNDGARLMLVPTGGFMGHRRPRSRVTPAERMCARAGHRD